MKKRVSRAEKRARIAEVKMNGEMVRIIQHFFPELIASLRAIDDPRNQSYVRYKSEVILMVRILAAVFRIGSMRKTTEEFSSEESIRNVSILLRSEEQEELPHWSTINDYLEKANNEEIEEIIQKVIYRIIRMRTFEGSRLRGKYWQIVVDGTGLYSSNRRHCAKCLVKTHKDGHGKVKWTEYYHSVLEAKLVVNEDIVLSIGTEFIENEKADAPKQDCEVKAFHRLAAKVKKAFPRLPICVGMDSLYAGGPVFDLCRGYGWQYIIRFKDGSMPAVARDFHALKLMEESQTFTVVEDDVTKTYRYVKGIEYQSHSLSMVECVMSDREYPFVFLTSLPVSRRNCAQLVADGRRRWKIENQGFNSQKNHGFELKHLFSLNYNAIKNHYLLIQIAHMIAQIFHRANDLWHSIDVPDYRIFDLLRASFVSSFLPPNDFATPDTAIKYRFY